MSNMSVSGPGDSLVNVNLKAPVSPIHAGPFSPVVVEAGGEGEARYKSTVGNGHADGTRAFTFTAVHSNQQNEKERGCLTYLMVDA